MSNSLSFGQAVLPLICVVSTITAYALGKVVGANDERTRIVRSKANIEKNAGREVR
jgi:hypothetical protein